MNARSYFNLMFLGTFLIEIMFGIIGIFKLHTDILVILTSVIFVFGIFTIVGKNLLHLLAFCIAHIAPILILIESYPYDETIRFTATLVIILFDSLFVILLIIIWKNNVINNSITLLHNNFFLSPTINDLGLTGIHIFVAFLPPFILTFSSTIIRKELRFYMFFIYCAIFGQVLFVLYYLDLDLMGFITWTSLILLFVNTILCHINFGKKLKFYLTFDPDLGREYEYSNDFNLENDDDKEEEKDEKVFETLNRYWKTIKKNFYNAVILQILNLIE
ncbi:hypothetical protein C1645_837807 [Glomus cerebriforme]|uniref:Uncharacterized protein n=1 Tax=Glomus cerebriforme TaxID=658196 RepID=A0A397S880_9GLOM|nr:hypothetical protein C1645_837807 [Glomus cerebriforme]